MQKRGEYSTTSKITIDQGKKIAKSPLYIPKKYQIEKIIEWRINRTKKLQQFIERTTSELNELLKEQEAHTEDTEYNEEVESRSQDDHQTEPSTLDIHTLSYSSCPITEMYIKIDGFKPYGFHTLLDTGAEYFLARKYAIPQDLWKPSQNAIRFDSTKASSAFSADIPFKIGDQIVHINVHQYDMQTYDLLLGNLDLKRLKCKMNYTEDSVAFGDNVKKLKNVYKNIIPLASSVKEKDLNWIPKQISMNQSNLSEITEKIKTLLF